jgi:hypothetical protein
MGTVLFPAPEIATPSKNKITCSRQPGLMSSMCLDRAGSLFWRALSPDHGPPSECQHTTDAPALLCELAPVTQRN